MIYILGIHFLYILKYNLNLVSENHIFKQCFWLPMWLWVSHDSIFLQTLIKLVTLHCKLWCRELSYFSCKLIDDNKQLEWCQFWHHRHYRVEPTSDGSVWHSLLYATLSFTRQMHFRHIYGTSFLFLMKRCSGL